MSVLKVSGLALILLVFALTGRSYTRKADAIKIEGKTEAKAVYGGENLVYSFTATNTTSETVKDVTLIHYLPGATLVSAKVSQGIAEDNTRKLGANLRTVWARFGDIQGYASATLTIEIKTVDWGNDSDEKGSDSASVGPLSAMIEQIEKAGGDASRYRSRLSGQQVIEIVFPSAYYETSTPPERRPDKLRIPFHPSKNAAPRLEILFPADEVVIAGKVDSPTELTLRMRATDPDGKVVKVVVSDPARMPRFETFPGDDGRPMVRFNGKTYTREEFEANPDLQKFDMPEATPEGNGIYTYTLKGLEFGYKSVSAFAVDNGGRTSSVGLLRFQVAGDAKIGFSSLVDEQVIRPADVVRLETTSTIDDPKLNELAIDIAPVGPNYTNFAGIPRLRQVSAVGSVFKHEYLWKAPEEGVYNLRLYLMHNGYPVNDARITVMVAEERDIKITSVREGQEFGFNGGVGITVEARDIKGRYIDDELTILIDGKDHGWVGNAWRRNPAKEGVYELDPQQERKITDLARGSHTIQIIAKIAVSGRTTEVGRSKPVTVVVK